MAQKKISAFWCHYSIYRGTFFNQYLVLGMPLLIHSHYTVFPRIVSAETILFWNWKLCKFSYSFRIMAIFYFINWIVAAETMEGGKLFKGRNYLRKYGTHFFLKKQQSLLTSNDGWCSVYLNDNIQPCFKGLKHFDSKGLKYSWYPFIVIVNAVDACSVSNCCTTCLG